MKFNPLGYGSFFHEVSDEKLGLEDVTFTENYHLFYAGRYAIKAVFESIKAHKQVKNIWFPNYYCPFVKNWLEHEYDNLRYYQIDPFDPEAQLDWSIFNHDADVVLLNNYWGLKEYTIPKEGRPIIVEDHSHGWLSNASLDSKADFCIASLRKTVPIPLGGIAWKPAASQVPFDLDEKHTEITDPPLSIRQSWNFMKEAMNEKATYKNPSEVKNYLTTYTKGEELVRQQFEISPMGKEHQKEASKYIFKDYHKPKKANLAYLKSLMNKPSIFKILEKDGFEHFGLLLIFKNRKDIEAMKSYLISKSIFPAELWRHNTLDQEYNHLLNIHIDFRYDPQDMEYIATQLNRFHAN